MAASVKLDEDTTSRLEELQALVKLRTGRTVTPQGLLDRLVAQAYDAREAFVEPFRADDGWEGRSAEELERIDPTDLGSSPRNAFRRFPRQPAA